MRGYIHPLPQNVFKAWTQTYITFSIRGYALNSLARVRLKKFYIYFSVIGLGSGCNINFCEVLKII